MDKVTNVLPQELSGETKLGKYLYFKDVAFVMIYFVIMSYFENAVHENVRLFYYIFNIIVALILIIPSNQNPRRRLWKSILFVITKDRNVYENLPIKVQRIDYDKEELEKIYEKEKEAINNTYLR